MTEVIEMASLTAFVGYVIGFGFGFSAGRNTRSREK